MPPLEQIQSHLFALLKSASHFIVCVPNTEERDNVANYLKELLNATYDVAYGETPIAGPSFWIKPTWVKKAPMEAPNCKGSILFALNTLQFRESLVGTPYHVIHTEDPVERLLSKTETGFGPRGEPIDTAAKALQFLATTPDGYFCDSNDFLHGTIALNAASPKLNGHGKGWYSNLMVKSLPSLDTIPNSGELTFLQVLSLLRTIVPLYKHIGRDNEKLATKKQVQWLENYSVSISKELTLGQASALVDCLIKRHAAGLASFKQLWALNRLRGPISSTISCKEADAWLRAK